MENKARKMFAAVVVIMLCAVAIVGIGYAYTASTQNSNNNVSAEYLTLTQVANGVHEGQYNFADDLKVCYNTLNTGASTTNYKLADCTYGTPRTGYTLVQIGESFKIHAEHTGTNSADIVCTASASSISVPDDWVVCLKVGETWLTSTDGITFDVPFVITASSGTSYNDVVVEVYYGYAGEGGVDEAPTDTPFNDAIITFTATKGLVLSKSSISGSSGGQEITASFSGITPGDVNVVWVSSSESIVTVAADGDNKSVATLTKVADGSATITATITIDGVAYKAVCSVTYSSA